MPATTHAEFNEKTEGAEVANAFSGEIRGKTILVTGVNRGGIGFTTAEAFASQSPAHLIIAGRNQSKLQESIDVLRARFPAVDYRVLKVDLSSQNSVRAAAAEALSWSEVPVIDIIVNSAGVMCIPERTINEDGIEMHFATNHIGHFLLTNLLMPKLLKAAEENPIKGATRVVNVSSLSPTVSRMRWSDLNFNKRNKDLPDDEKPAYDIHRAFGWKGNLEDETYLPLEGYNQSKVANVLFGIAANKRLYGTHGIVSVSVHPGVIPTELGRNMGHETRESINLMREKGMISYKTAGAGVATSLVAALDPKLECGEAKDDKENYGIFLIDCQLSDKLTHGAASIDEAEKLWALSEDLVKEKFAW